MGASALKQKTPPLEYVEKKTRREMKDLGVEYLVEEFTFK